MPHLSVAERVARGKAARSEVPRSRPRRLSTPSSAAGRSDRAPRAPSPRPRVPELVPMHGTGGCLSHRLRSTAGAAMIMAHDLEADAPLRADLCSAAVRRTPVELRRIRFTRAQRLVFDPVNDFDETSPGPWEWDVKRLAASMLIAARDNGYRRQDEEQDRARHGCAATGPRWPSLPAMQKPGCLVLAARDRERDPRARAGLQAEDAQAGRTEQTLAKARTKDSMTAFSKLTTSVNGTVRIIDQSPLIVPIDQLAAGQEARGDVRDPCTSTSAGTVRRWSSIGGSPARAVRADGLRHAR